MSLKQTRRGYSVTGELYDEVLKLSEAKRIPQAQIVAQALRAVLDGRIELTPAVPSAEVGELTSIRRGLLKPADQRLKRRKNPSDVIRTTLKVAVAVDHSDASTQEEMSLEAIAGLRHAGLI